MERATSTSVEDREDRVFRVVGRMSGDEEEELLSLLSFSSSPVTGSKNPVAEMRRDFRLVDLLAGMMDFGIVLSCGKQKT